MRRFSAEFREGAADDVARVLLQREVAEITSRGQAEQICCGARRRDTEQAEASKAVSSFMRQLRAVVANEVGFQLR